MMKDFIESIHKNNGMLELPLEYAEYLNTRPKEIVFHDPENEQQAKLAAKVKLKTGLFLGGCSAVLLFLFVYVIVSKNTLLVISLMGLITFLFSAVFIQLLTKKTQVAIGRAVIKIKQRKSYSYFVSVAVDEPEKAIHANIPVSKSDYEKISEGTSIMIVNISSPGKGVVLD